MHSTKRLWTPEARARQHLKLGPNTILAIMRHGCSILTATISRSFIKAKLIFEASKKQVRKRREEDTRMRTLQCLLALWIVFLYLAPRSQAAQGEGSQKVRVSVVNYQTE